MRILRISLCCAAAALVLFRLISCAVRQRDVEFEGRVLIVDGVRYVPASFQYTGTDRMIGREDGWSVYPITEDPFRTFLEVSSFLDQTPYVREDYAIPDSGEISVVYIDNSRYEDAALCRAVSALITDPPEASFRLRTDAIFTFAESVYVGYAGCPVGTDFAGYVGCPNGEWLYFTPADAPAAEGAEREYLCHPIPPEYIGAFQLFPHYLTPDTLPETEAA